MFFLFSLGQKPSVMVSVLDSQSRGLGLIEAWLGLCVVPSGKTLVPYFYLKCLSHPGV